MKRSSLLSLVLGIAGILLVDGRLLGPGVPAQEAATESTGSLTDAQQSSGLLGEKERRERHEQWLLDLHKDSKGQVRPDLWRKGIEQTKRMRIAAGVSVASVEGVPGKLGTAAAGGVVGVQWTQIGPAPLRIDHDQIYQGAGPDSGFVGDIAIDPRNASDQVIYIATKHGGIWKSNNGGTSWQPKTDFMPSLSMGALALDPLNPSIVYAGTRDRHGDTGLMNLKSLGLYKSIDAGETWTVLNPGGIFNDNGINRIVLPASEVLLVGARTGLYRSADSGLHFGANSPQFNDGNAILPGFISDLDRDSASSSTIYASVARQGIFRSTDSGVTFPINLFANPNAPTAGSYDFIAFAQSTQPDNQTLYALVQNRPNGSSARLFKSTTGGSTWVEMADAANRSAENRGCQCGYDQTLGVDPQDSGRVYIGFQELYLSTDGGTIFGTPAISRNKIHFDQQALTFSPRSHWGASPTRIWVGTDGGVHSSTNGGSDWLNLNETIATNLINGIDIGRGSSFNNGFTYGGCQDTGTVQKRPDYPDLDWHLGTDGDGGPPVVDPTNPYRAYGGYDGGFICTDNGGNSWNCGGGKGLTGCCFSYAVDPNNNLIVYAAGGDLFQSTDMGVNFTPIHSVPSSTGIVSIANVGIDSNVVWIGLGDGTVQYTTNALAGSGSTWIARTVTGAPPNQPVKAIAIDPLNTDEVVVVYPGFCGGACAPGNRTRHVFRTTDRGATWVDISGNDGGGDTGDLPDLPLWSVVIDRGTAPHTIVVASDSAVMRTANLGASWEILGVGLPIVYCTSLALDSDAAPSLLRVSTYGRSAFELTAATGPLLAVNTDLGFGPVCVGDSATRLVQIFNVGSEDLHVSSFTRVAGSTDFQIISGPPTPVTVLPGEEIDYTIEFKPTSVGNLTATFQINSDDPTQPRFQLPASGTGTVARIATLIADAGAFGDVCVGAFKDLDLTISNSGSCDLSVSSITSSSGQFKVAGAMSFPLVIGPGGSLAVPIRFEPASIGATNADLTVTSSDLSTPVKMVHVTGNAPPGDVRVTGSTDFGDVCAGTQAEKAVLVCDVGKCDLHVTSLGFDPACADFTLVNNPFPAPVSPDSCEQVVVRFTPTSCGAKSCTLKIVTDDPDTPVIVVPVTTNTPCPSIDVPPDMGYQPTVISGVGACVTPEPFPVSNTGSCPLTITGFAIATGAAEYSVSGLPSFPIILEPGHEAGEGDLSIDFAPDDLGRERAATVKVTYVSDPVTGATMDMTRALCGEGVRTGARVLVTSLGVPMASVEQIKLQRINANRNLNFLDTVDNARNLTLQTVVPAAPCGTFQYHREYGTVTNPIQLLPGSYQVTVSAIVNGRRARKTVGFDVTTCGFNPSIVINF